MVWENDGDKSEKILNVIEGVADEDVLILKAAEYDENGEIHLFEESSRGRFYFTGTLNTNANIVWQEKISRFALITSLYMHKVKKIQI